MKRFQPDMALRPLNDLAELDCINAQFATEPERMRALCDVYLARPTHLNALTAVDPFDPAYLVAVRGWLAEITGRRDYAPTRDELAPYLEDPAKDATVVPSIYSFGDATFVGDMLQSYGAVLKALDVRPGQSVLEYGPGDGQICLNLARMGCRVTAVDIEARYLGMIRSQARALGVTVQTIQAEFGTAEPGLLYDRILFFESFHHALGHQDLMGRLCSQLAADGAIVFAGEPILEATNYYRKTLPYAWGPRLDGFSLRAMRRYGWCELGYTREYFVDLMMRSGLLVTFRREPATDRGSAYIATRAGQTINLGGPFLLEAVDTPDCWHPGEGAMRWTRTPTAGIPIDRLSGWRQVTLELHNPLPVTKPVDLRLGRACEQFMLQPGEERSVAFPLSGADGPMTLTCPVDRPCDLNAASTDDRPLGIAVSKLRYNA
jgi:2-polyprenyl-3-methyl-5-hydroxy-6-metoxy-1,4-benzoquinol methylase